MSKNLGSYQQINIKTIYLLINLTLLSQKKKRAEVLGEGRSFRERRVRVSSVSRQGTGVGLEKSTRQASRESWRINGFYVSTNDIVVGRSF